MDAHLESIGLTCECLGGGKIEHNPQEKSITIFGTSQVRCTAVVFLAFKIAIQPYFYVSIFIYITMLITQNYINCGHN